jgi:SRSO17 transposase
MAMIPGPDWQTEFETWLAPSLDRLGRREQRRWAPVYLQGLIGPGERTSVAPLAARVAPGAVRQLHHSVAASPWGRSSRWRRSWSGRPTGWSAGLMPCW